MVRQAHGFMFSKSDLFFCCALELPPGLAQQEPQPQVRELGGKGAGGETGGSCEVCGSVCKPSTTTAFSFICTACPAQGAILFCHFDL